MNKIIVLTGSIVGIAYLTELFIAWYGQNPYEQFCFLPEPGEFIFTPTDGLIIS